MKLKLILVVIFAIAAVMATTLLAQRPPSDYFYNISVAETTENSALIIWTSQDALGSNVEYGYTDAYGMTSSDTSRVQSHELLLTGLEANTHYHFRIVGENAEGIQMASEDFSFTTVASGSSELTITDYEITVQDGSGNVYIRFFTNLPATSVIDFGLSESYGSTLETGSPSTTHTYELLGTDLEPGATYHVRFTASNQDQHVLSSDYTFQAWNPSGNDTEAPAAITTLAAKDIGNTSLVLTWDKPADNVGVIHYHIRMSKKEITESNFSNDAETIEVAVVALDTISPEPETHRYQVVGLDSNTLYYFAVKAMDAAGNMSALSNPTTGTTTASGGGHSHSNPVPVGGTKDDLASSAQDIIPPSPLSNVRAAALDSEIQIFWNNPKTSDYVRTKIVRNEKRYPSNPEDGTVVFDGNREMFTDKGVKNETTYYYALFAYDKTPNYSLPSTFSISPRGGINRVHFFTKPETPLDVPSFKITRNFKLGDSGDEVSHVQELLATDPVLYPEGITSGNYDQATFEAVKRLQARAGLPITGMVDDATREKIADISRKVIITSSPIETGTVLFERALHYGSRGNDVRYLQEILIQEELMNDGPVDGIFGQVTKKAVINFQIKHAITPAIGYVGKKTMSAIYEIVKHTVAQ